MASQLPISIGGSNPSDLSMNSNPNLEMRNESFTCFPRLPPELKLRVWKLALPTSRIITVLENAKPPDFSDHTPVLRDSEVHLLHACQDSRAAVLKLYSVRHIPHFGHPIYLNPSSDAFMITRLDTTPLFNSFNPSMTGITRFLGVSFGICRSHSCHLPDTAANQQRDESRIRSAYAVRSLAILIESIGTLEKLVVYLPSCVNQYHATKEGVAGALRGRLQSLDGPTNGDDSIIPYEIPAITFQGHDCSLSDGEIEDRLRKHMESTNQEL